MPEQKTSFRNAFVAESTFREGVPPEKGLCTPSPMTIHVIPQAHIDLLWYWDTTEAVRMVLNTFRRHAAALEAHPDYTFCQSQAWAYEMVRQSDPALFERIRALVAEGRWECVGGEWVESDPAIPGHEARVRQFLFGQRFFKQHFNTTASVAWSPDGFSVHPSSFPQIFRQAGLRYFVHKRPRERYGHLPLLPYRWRGPDGSEIVCYRSNNKGKGLPNVSEGWPLGEGKGDLAEIADAFAEAGLNQLWGPLGVGDIGGFNRYDLPPTSPQFTRRYSTPSRFFKALSEQVREDALPRVEGSLPPAFMGCMTTMADLKEWNRRAENLLLQAESVAAWAAWSGLAHSSSELHDAWLNVLSMQFHDAVTGCGNDETRGLIRHTYREAANRAETVRTRHLRALAESVRTDPEQGAPVVVFNPLGHGVSTMVECRVTLDAALLPLAPFGDPQAKCGKLACRAFIPPKGGIAAWSPAGDRVPVMLDWYRELQTKYVAGVRFWAGDLPPYGYRTFYLRPDNPLCAHAARPAPENELDFHVGPLNLRFSPRGGLARVEDTATGLTFSSAAAPLGSLRLHPTGTYPINYGVELRAWEAGLTGEELALDPVRLEVREYSGERGAVVYHYAHGKSRFTQEFLVEPGADFVEVTVSGDWQEIERYLKIHVQFETGDPVTALADLPYGVTPTLPENVEYAMQHWCAMKDRTKAVAILNNSRHGCLWKNRSLSLSAIRCSTYPAPLSDRGEFALSYRLVFLDAARPDWMASVFRKAFEFNVGPVGYAPEYSSHERPGQQSLIAGPIEGVLATCLKPAEDGGRLVLRLFNPSDEPATADIPLPEGCRACQAATILEEPGDPLPIGRGRVKLTFRPWELKTLLLENA